MRKLLILSALAVMALLAGACGSSEDEGSSPKESSQEAKEPTAVETVQVAYKETAAERTARTSFEVTTTGPSAGPSAGPEADGQVVEPATFTMRGRGVVDFSGAEASMTVNMLGLGNLEMRQVGGTIYMKMPEDFSAQTPGARPWIEVDPKTVKENQSGANLGQTQPGIVQDPTGEFEYLRGVSESVEKVGVAEVRGTRTTHYRATIDLQEAAAEEDPGAQEAYDEMSRKLGAGKLPVEVWIDEKNRVRRYEIDMSVPVPESAASPGTSGEDVTVRTRMVTEYYDFGVPVDVQAPPRDQTMDGSEMLSGAQPAA